MEYAFVTGMGRSGTKFMSALLGKAPGVLARHEYIGNREFWLLSWYLRESDYTFPLLQRQKEIIEKAFPDGLFIDVNGMLQHCVPALRKAFDPKAVFHLVRDPREVVRSIYIRRNDKDVHIVPRDQGNFEKWMRSDKFFQVCWNWATATSTLLEQDTRLIRFEDLVSDYVYCRKRLLEPLGVHLDEQTWKTMADRPVNATRSVTFRRTYAWLRGKPYVRESLPSFDQWTPAQKNTLFEVCGDAMSRCGYPTG